jgi:8-oxo-dGTP diphosphatase
MPDDRIAARQLHLDDVETECARPVAQEPQICLEDPQQHPPLAPVHREISRHQRVLRPRLDLDEYERLAIAAHQIDLLPEVPGIAPIPGHDRKAARPPQEGGGGALPQGASIALVAHVICESSPVRIMTTPDPTPGLAYKIAVLVFIQNGAGEHLLLLRAKPPNLGVWSPIGGKLETAGGESPFECAVREIREEAGLAVAATDLHLFAMIAEKAYEGDAHWLLFLFHCKTRIPALPADIGEGRFGFFSREAIQKLPIPETDRNALWPIFDRHRDRFVALKADCAPGRPVRVEIEEITPAGADNIKIESL